LGFNRAAPAMARKQGGKRIRVLFSPMLQWSRANNGAETYQLGNIGVRCLLASMEPRQQWRGNLELCLESFSPVFASMEPRQQWRGNTLPSITVLSLALLQWSRANNGAETSRRRAAGTASPGFNGAAPTMARKRSDWPDHAKSAARFNGAAPTMARKQ